MPAILSKLLCGTHEQRLQYEVYRYILFLGFKQDFGINITVLAQKGYYPTGRKVEVICFCCKVRVTDWKKGDVPESKHISGCVFLTEQSPNVPWTEEDANELMKDDYASKNEAIAHGKLLPAEAKTNIKLTKYVAATYVETFNNYTLTFEHWSGTKEDIEAWAEGGFIYKESKKILICPYCKLKPRFVRGDCPLELHGEYMPGCFFVMEMRRCRWIPNQRRLLATPKDNATKSDEPKNGCEKDTILYERDNFNLRPEMGYKEKTYRKEAMASPMDESNQNEVIKANVLCKICMENISCITFLPCLHLNCCEDCAKKVLTCESCKSPKRGEIHCFR